jgi:dTDP-4-dehydrorhamnose 3,5-epimerase
LQFHTTTLEGAWLIDLEHRCDSRGFFARTFCVQEFTTHGLETSYPQHSISFSARRGTVRGMHFQCKPHSEVKLVRCLKGSIYDVIIDIRPNSPTYRQWQGFDLSDVDGRQLYIPKGFAHGFQTLSDRVEVNYLISEPYDSEAACGIRFDDPSFSIAWPLAITEISPKDLSWPNFVGEHD